MVENAQVHTSAVILQPQQQVVYHDDRGNNFANDDNQCSHYLHNHKQHHPQEWSVGLQNYHPNIVDPSITIPYMDVAATADFGPFVPVPQTVQSTTNYLQPSQSMQPSQCAISANGVVYVTQQQTQPLVQQDATCTTVTSSVPSSYYQPQHKYSPTTVLDLGSGTIHKSLEQHRGDNECDHGWPHFQSSSSLSYKLTHHHHQFYEEHLGDHALNSVNIDQRQYKTVNETAIKTEVDSNGVSEHSLDLQIYSIDQISDTATQVVDYYSHHHQLSSSSSSDVADTTNSVSIDFIGDGAGCSSLSDPPLVENYIVLDSTKLLNNNNETINNNYFGEPFCDTETNTTANGFNEFPLNTVNLQWS